MSNAQRRPRMLTRIGRRLVQAFGTLIVLSVLIFVGTEILPGDVATATLGQSASDETLAAVRAALQLDRPAPLRYWNWLTHLAAGDPGRSLANRAPIGPEVATRLANTLWLAGSAAVIVVPLSVFIGIFGAVWPNTLLDRAVNLFGLAAISLPEYFICYLLILVFSIQLSVLPSLSTPIPGAPMLQQIATLVLPVSTLVLAVFAYIQRTTRNAILAVMHFPYIEMARLKGLSASRIVLFHALPNALAPIIQVIAFNLAYMVVGVVLVEVVFVYPGIGQYLVEAVMKRDVPVVQICGLVFGATFVFINLIADVLVIAVNPRLRLPS